MDVKLTARHCSISDALRRRAEERLEALQRYEPTLSTADVRFAMDHGSPTTEVRLLCRRITVQASAGGASLQAAFDAAIQRAERQLRRRRERVTDHKAPAMDVVPDILSA